MWQPVQTIGINTEHPQSQNRQRPTTAEIREFIQELCDNSLEERKIVFELNASDLFIKQEVNSV